MGSKKIHRIIISRTDAIGDVVLTLPLASVIKKILGCETQVIFFGSSYTMPVINCCDAIDECIDYNSFKDLDETGRKEFLRQIKADAIIHVFPRKDIAHSAKQAGIGLRIGTTNRLFHWWSCNKLIRLGRKNSSLHEAQLNLKLISALGFREQLNKEELAGHYQLNCLYELPEKLTTVLSKNKFNLIIHPKSNSSAREWSMEHYKNLIHLLPAENFRILITGGEKEKSFLDSWVQSIPEQVINLSGLLTLNELISLLNSCDGIVAASTGPLHIASALGKHALGIYPPIKPMNPTRWAPIGKQAEYLVIERSCKTCKNLPASCHCINEITPRMVADRVLHWKKI